MKISVFFAGIVIIYIVALLPYVYFSITTIAPRHTYGLPSGACSNTLTSERGDFEVIRQGLTVVFYLLAPWTLAFMLYTKERIGWSVHIIYLFLIIIWGLIMFAFDVSDALSANVPPNDESYKRTNLARDTKWCSLFGGQAGTELVCENTDPCVGPGVLVEDLFVNGPFAYRLGANFFLVLVCALDFYYSATGWSTGEVKKK